MRAEEFEYLGQLADGPRDRELCPKGPWELIREDGILFSAPHEATQLRDGVEKVAERGTADLAFALARATGGTALATADRQLGDPNWDVGHPYIARAKTLAGDSEYRSTARTVTGQLQSDGLRALSRSCPRSATTRAILQCGVRGVHLREPHGGWSNIFVCSAMSDSPERGRQPTSHRCRPQLARGQSRASLKCSRAAGSVRCGIHLQRGSRTPAGSQRCRRRWIPPARLGSTTRHGRPRLSRRRPPSSPLRAVEHRPEGSSRTTNPLQNCP